MAIERDVPRPPRLFPALCGAWLIALGTETYRLGLALNDQAYLWLAILVPLAPVGVGLLIVAALPASWPRTVLWYVSIGLLWIVGGAGVALLGPFAIMPFTRGIPTSAVPFWYLLGFVVLLLTLYVVGIRLPRTYPSARYLWLLAFVFPLLVLLSRLPFIPFRLPRILF